MGTEMHEVAVFDAGVASMYMPVMNIQAAIQRYNAVLEFTKQIMKEGKDYGAVPGTDKPTLLKPGAEKLCSFFGLTPKFLRTEVIEYWHGPEYGGSPLFYYTYKCQLFRGDWLVAESEGSCSSWESKYRYRWVSEDLIPEWAGPKEKLAVRDGRKKAFEFDFSLNKKETSGKYGKPMSYWEAFEAAIRDNTAKRVKKPTSRGEADGWEIQYGEKQYRIPNPDVFDQINTIQKIAQKRALIAATLIGCNASEYFTQDLEDLEAIDVPFSVVGKDTPPWEDLGQKAEQQHKTEQKPEPPQPPAPEPEFTPAELDDILRRCNTSKGCMDVLKEMREGFKTFNGDDLEFYSELNSHNVKQFADLKGASIDAVKKIVRGLYFRLNASKEMFGAHQDDAKATVGGDLQ